MTTAVEDKPRVMSAKAVFRLFDYSENAGYAAIREGTFPIPCIRVGPRKIVFATAAVERLLGGWDAT